MPGLGTNSLFSELDVVVEPDAPIGQRTWYGIGGRADLLVHPQSVDSLAQLIRRCSRSSVPVHILGAGANVLVADEGVGGIVISLDDPAFREVRYAAEGKLDRMKVMAGADVPKTLMEVARRGLDGLCQMAGIPATFGGAIRMNAGGAFGCIGDAVESVTCITRAGDVVTYPADQLVFSYRKTNIPDPIIVSAVLRVREDDPIAIREKIKDIFAYKKKSQPLAASSAGCTFRNPWDPVKECLVSAGKLIDEAGLKGLSVGGAVVDQQHANFITVAPGTTTDAVFSLIEQIKQRVFEDSGLELEEEIDIWRRDGATD